MQKYIAQKYLLPQVIFMKNIQLIQLLGMDKYPNEIVITLFTNLTVM